jgi:hypothetical protein
MQGCNLSRFVNDTMSFRARADDYRLGASVEQL